MNPRTTTFFVITAILFLSACVRESGFDHDSGTIDVVTTTGMIADAVRNVGGDYVSVVSLMGTGVDPHLYKASVGDVTRLSEAEVIFFNGLHLEGKMSSVLDNMTRSGWRTVAVTETIDRSILRSPPEFEGHYDPHVWFDVTLWLQTLDPIVATLSEIKPEHADYFRARGEVYRKKLEELNRFCRSKLAEVPPERRIMITAHDAFGYFGRAYGIKVFGLQGINTTSEYGLRDVQRLADMIIGEKIKAVFVESSVPRRSIEAVVEGCKARGYEVEIGGELFSDSMGKAGTPEGNYIGMVRHNVNTIAEALK